MIFRKKYTLIAVSLNGADGFSQTLADAWNYGGSRTWFWTRRGADRAARFHSMMMPLGMLPVHEDDLEERLAALAPRA